MYMLTCVLTNEPGEGGLNRRERSKKKKSCLLIFNFVSFPIVLFTC